MSDKPASPPPLPPTYEQAIAESARLREILASYFDYDWGDKIGMWEELAEKALGRGEQQS